MWVTRLIIVDWVYSKTQVLQATLRTQNQPREEFCESLEAELLFQSVGCVKRQSAVSHSSTESEIISLDAGLRMDGLPALDLWDMVIEVLRSTNNTVQPNNNGIEETSARTNSKAKTQNDKRRQKDDQLSDVDSVATNTHSSQGESQMYIFEDDEDVIKMIIKGRSPTMRPVSRTRRVALDWLFDRIKLEPEIQMKFVDTKNQLADIFNERKFFT